jgi:hypothetical protein
MKTVRPIDVSGWSMSIFQLIGSGPKLTITCGECKGTFKKRVPMVDEPGVECPYCKTINRLPITV